MHHKIRYGTSLNPPFKLLASAVRHADLCRHLRVKLLTGLIASLLTSLLVCTTVSAQNFDKIIPMGDWLERKVITYSGDQIIMHVRTGYENAVVFPEPISLFAVNSRFISTEYDGVIPGVGIEFNNKEMKISPLKRMQATTVAVRGTTTGTIYEIIVNSSPNGSRQPIEILR